jgi:transposase-like protein
MKRKAGSLAWARKAVEEMEADVQPWLEQPLERLEALLPKRKMQVYWLMTCPACLARLPFDPFNDREAACQKCHKTFSLDQTSPAKYPAYAGTLYEGWGCYYLLAISRTAQQLALLHALGADRSYAERSAEILKLFARHIRPLPVQGTALYPVLWTYHKEGDCKIVISLAEAHELLRGVEGLFSPEGHRAIQMDLLKHWVDAVFRNERDSSPVQNNVFNYLSSVALVGCAIEDADYVDWAFGRRLWRSAAPTTCIPWAPTASPSCWATGSPGRCPICSRRRSMTRSARRTPGRARCAGRFSGSSPRRSRTSRWRPSATWAGASAWPRTR